MNQEPKPKESLLDGDFSCETTEDLYEPTDDELLYPSRHYEWFHDKMPNLEKRNVKVCDNGEICF
jgi:hypothetical protein